MQAGKERLTRETVRDATGQEIQQLRRDNDELKQLVADLSLEVCRIKKTAIPVPAGGYVNRCVNDIRRRPSQPLSQRRSHPRIERRDRRLRSTQGPSDA